MTKKESKYIQRQAYRGKTS